MPDACCLRRSAATVGYQFGTKSASRVDLLSNRGRFSAHLLKEAVPKPAEQRCGTSDIVSHDETYIADAEATDVPTKCWPPPTTQSRHF